jgi:pantothenate kinase
MASPPQLIPAEQFQRIISLIHELHEQKPCGPVLVAVSGVPGSGKTTLARRIVQELNKSVGTNGGAEIAINMPMDGYHFYRYELDRLDNPQEAHRRRGAEWTFNAAKLLRDLQGLKATGRLNAPGFDHAAGDPVENEIHITSDHKIVVVEGNYLTYDGTDVWKSVIGLFDLKVFLNADLATSTERLTRRHMNVWGVPREVAAERAKGSDYENALLVQKTASAADMVCDSLDW